METKTIQWSDFEKIEMRVGTILNATIFKEAKNPSYIIQIDFGSEIGLKKTSAQLTFNYSPENLIGKQVIAVVNFPKKQIATIQSECLILGAINEKSVVLIHPDCKVTNGLRIG